MARLHSCNVLQTSAGKRQLWQFNVGGFELARESVTLDGEFLPASLAQKNWPQLWQPRLNIAWLPPEDVFFRVIELPTSSLAETHSMVELQLEKLSPIPVGQAVWSVHPLPPQSGVPAGAMQTVVVVFAERKKVEDFLGSLEGQGYLADRIELQALDQIAAANVQGNGAWIYPGLCGGPNTALVAWWYGGKLQSLSTLSLGEAGDRSDAIKEQLAQMAWAGELEGWLTSLPTWTLVADDEDVAKWETELRKAMDTAIHLVDPLKPVELAALTAKRSAQSDGKGNLIPPEYATRYRNQFMDRLWIRGALALGALYLLAVAIYFGTVSVQEMRVGGVESTIEGLSTEYTNSMQLGERYKILKTREELKFAALDCWKVVAEMLPESATLDRFNFSDGRKLILSGTVTGDAVNDIIKFYGDIRKATLKNQPMFDSNAGQALNTSRGPGGAVVVWNFSLELKRKEGE